MGLDRRRFLQITAATAAASQLPACEVDRPPGPGVVELPTDPGSWPARQERRVTGVCDLCPGGCGIEARTMDGRAVSVRGNPRSPVNRGGLCGRGQALVEVTYHPERVRQPMRRSGERGSGAWEPVGWDEALAEVSSHLRTVRDGGHPERLLMLGGEFRGLLQEAFHGFARAFGTPNAVRFRRHAFDQPAVSHALATGTALPVACDLERATMILSFGCNLLEEWASPVHQIRAIARARTRPRDRARYVEVGPRASLSATLADRWIPLRPGLEAALALGMAQVIVREGLYDRRFVEEHATGMEPWIDAEGTRHPGFRQYLLDRHPPQVTEELTGVPVAVLMEEARRFAQSPRSVAIGEPLDPYGQDDVYARLAILSLNALVGAIGRTGGLLVQQPVPLGRLPEPPLDAAARSGLAQVRIDGAGQGQAALARDAVQALPGALLGAGPRAVDIAMLVRANPVYGHPAGSDFSRALAEVPYVVAVTSFLDETSAHADLVLPEPTALEAWADDEVAHLAGFSSFSVGAPAIEPLYDTRPAYEVLAALAAAVGSPVSDALPHPTVKEAIHARARGLWEARRGWVIRREPSEELRRVIQGQGYWYQEHDDFEAFWSALVQAGGWWDPDNAIPSFGVRFGTPSGKYEFDVSALRDLARRGEGPPVDAAFAGLPAARPLERAVPAGSRDRYPFQLATFRTLSSQERHAVNLPLLQEAPSPFLEHQVWGAWVEVHPHPARELGIQDGDPVWVTSPRGRVRVRARIVPGHLDDVVAMPLFTGHASTRSWTARAGGEPVELLVDVLDTLTGIGVPAATWVRLDKT